ncbi:uncharacterized protein [Temnothorax longispinosus]|uniref:uncharacterized protein n=1 Tax=Temnothorax longispinosus TaxID=300112 RepID=UPI003A9A293A
MCAMTKSIRTILTPFLIISYVFGLRIVNLSKYSRLWFSVLYMLLLWSVYCILSTSALISSFNELYPIEDSIFYWLESYTTLLSIVFGIYHEKKFQNCLRKLDIVDSTLFKLGTVTDYNKLRKKTVRLVLGWFMIVILTIYSVALSIKNEYNRDNATSIFYVLIRDYCFHINFIGDLTTASILEYIGLKFDQINEHLQNLTRNNKRKIKQAWQKSRTHQYQRRFSKTLNRKCIIWIITHLHLELRKISSEIDSIFGTQMTFKMACYFGWIVVDLREILNGILINNYVKYWITWVIIYFIWFSHNVSKFLLINYMCETVSTKASATADLLNRLSYFTRDNEIREIISQFSLRIVYAPLRFYGIGFFQFGFKFLHRFVMSIATLLVIIIQAQGNK